MQRFVYWLAMAFIFPVSHLPFWALYRVSDGLYLLLYYVVGYRRSVVKNNLALAFPEKSPAERKQIQKAFYRHLCDVVVESLKSYTISPEAIRKRIPICNPELFYDYADKGQTIIIVTAHYGNWEWAALAQSVFSPFVNYAVYRPLSNPWFDRMVKRNRERFNLALIPQQDVAAKIRHTPDAPELIAFLTDQSPANIGKAMWLRFLGQDTAVEPAVERLVRLAKRPVVYGAIRKLARGRYEINLVPIHDAPETLEPGELTRLYFAMLENMIHTAPPYWLWSHRRWKHRRKG